MEDEIKEIDRLLRLLVATAYHPSGTKKCTSCGEGRDLEGFSPRDAKKDGLCSICKGCLNERAKQYYRDNLEKVRERGKVYSALTRKKDGYKEKYNKYVSEWRQKNLESQREWHRLYAREHSAEVRKRQRERARSDPLYAERLREYQRRWANKAAKELKDGYVARGLLGLRPSQVPHKLLEAKRLQVKIKRFVKESR